jgi:transposase-like protein
MDMMVNEINGVVANRVVADSLRVEGLLMGSRAGGRAKFDPDKKRELVDIFEQSGASLADVASANNLKIDLLRQWVNQARTLSGAARKPRKIKKIALQSTLLPLVMKPASADRSSTNAGVAAAGIEVMLPKGTIRWPSMSGMDSAVLRTLVELLA